MAETYFSSVFKKFNGISPWEYITIKRVENAVELIKNTNMTKLEIAEKCGFSSSSNFYKAFFNITGKNLLIILLTNKYLHQQIRVFFHKT